jgi:predicted transcriptional regulator
MQRFGKLPLKPVQHEDDPLSKPVSHTVSSSTTDDDVRQEEEEEEEEVKDSFQFPSLEERDNDTYRQEEYAFLDFNSGGDNQSDPSNMFYTSLNGLDTTIDKEIYDTTLKVVTKKFKQLAKALLAASQIIELSKSSTPLFTRILESEREKAKEKRLVLTSLEFTNEIAESLSELLALADKDTENEQKLLKELIPDYILKRDNAWDKVTSSLYALKTNLQSSKTSMTSSLDALKTHLQRSKKSKLYKYASKLYTALEFLVESKRQILTCLKKSETKSVVSAYYELYKKNNHAKDSTVENREDSTLEDSLGSFKYDREEIHETAEENERTKKQEEEYKKVHHDSTDTKESDLTDEIQRVSFTIRTIILEYHEEDFMDEDDTFKTVVHSVIDNIAELHVLFYRKQDRVVESLLANFETDILPTLKEFLSHLHTTKHNLKDIILKRVLEQVDIVKPFTIGDVISQETINLLEEISKEVNDPEIKEEEIEWLTAFVNRVEEVRLLCRYDSCEEAVERYTSLHKQLVQELQELDEVDRSSDLEKKSGIAKDVESMTVEELNEREILRELSKQEKEPYEQTGKEILRDLSKTALHTIMYKLEIFGTKAKQELKQIHRRIQYRPQREREDEVGSLIIPQPVEDSKDGHFDFSIGGRKIEGRQTKKHKIRKRKTKKNNKNKNKKYGSRKRSRRTKIRQPC